jgi:hypothetical protein
MTRVTQKPTSTIAQASTTPPAMQYCNASDNPFHLSRKDRMSLTVRSNSVWNYSQPLHPHPSGFRPFSWGLWSDGNKVRPESVSDHAAARSGSSGNSDAFQTSH